MRPLSLVCLAAVLIAGSANVPQAQPGRPNIPIIQADDLGDGDLSAYGQSRFQTPSLDRLAREGIKFT
jgi:arylsulfatase A-like enzyme